MIHMDKGFDDAADDRKEKFDRQQDGLDRANSKLDWLQNETLDAQEKAAEKEAAERKEKRAAIAAQRLADQRSKEQFKMIEQLQGDVHATQAVVKSTSFALENSRKEAAVGREENAKSLVTLTGAVEQSAADAAAGRKEEAAGREAMMTMLRENTTMLEEIQQSVIGLDQKLDTLPKKLVDAYKEAKPPVAVAVGKPVDSRLRPRSVAVGSDSSLLDEASLKITSIEQSKAVMDVKEAVAAVHLLEESGGGDKATLEINTKISYSINTMLKDTDTETNLAALAAVKALAPAVGRDFSLVAARVQPEILTLLETGSPVLRKLLLEVSLTIAQYSASVLTLKQTVKQINRADLQRDSEYTVTLIMMLKYALEMISEEEIYGFTTDHGASKDLADAIATSFAAGKSLTKKAEKMAVKNAVTGAFKVLGMRAAAFAYRLATKELPKSESQKELVAKLNVVFQVAVEHDAGVATDTPEAASYDATDAVNLGFSKLDSFSATKSDLKKLEQSIKDELRCAINAINAKPGGLPPSGFAAPPPPPLPSTAAKPLAPLAAGANPREQLLHELKQKLEKRNMEKQRVLNPIDYAIMDEGEKDRHAERQAAEESPDSVVSMKTALESRIMARRAACNEDGEEADDADDAVAVS